MGDVFVVLEGTIFEYKILRIIIDIATEQRLFCSLQIISCFYEKSVWHIYQDHKYKSRKQDTVHDLSVDLYRLATKVVFKIVEEKGKDRALEQILVGENFHGRLLLELFVRRKVSFWIKPFCYKMTSKSDEPPLKRNPIQKKNI